MCLKSAVCTFKEKGGSGQLVVVLKEQKTDEGRRSVGSWEVVDDMS